MAEASFFTPQTVSAIAVSLVTVVGGYISLVRKIKAEMTNSEGTNVYTEIQRLRERNDMLIEKNDSLVREVAELNSKLAVLEMSLTTKISMLESSNNDMPIPIWLKDLDGKVLYVNDVYARTFLIPRGYTANDYVNHYDSDVWPAEVSESFNKNDSHVQISGEIWEGEELVESANGEIELWQIMKYPRHHNGRVIGIGGIAIKRTRSADFLNKVNRKHNEQF